MGLRPGSALTPWLIESIVRLGTSVPFGHAAALLAHFTGVTVDPETIRRLTEAVGAAQVARETAAVAELERTLRDGPVGPAVQQVSVDGAMAPLRDGVWAEVKTLVVGTVTRQGDGGRATDLSYFSRLADVATFAHQATVETHRRGTATAGTVVAVTDGAAWCQGFVDLHRPDAVRILDFPHAVEHLGAAAQAAFGAGTPGASEWLGTQAHRLRHGEEEDVLTALTELAATPSLTAAAQAVVTGVQRYLAARRAQIAYQRFAAAGYPIGSGCVESANKVVVEARLKGAGMHWARRNVDPLLALRTLVANDRWAEEWPLLWRQARRRDRPPQPPPPPPAPASAPGNGPPPRQRPKLVVNGKPTPDHPWRRSSPVRAKT